LDKGRTKEAGGHSGKTGELPLNETKACNNANYPVTRIMGTAIAVLFLALVVLPRISAAQPAGEGKQLFEKRCTGCHALESNKEGPNLGGVYGRHAGTAPGFNYSSALKSANFVWDEQRLDKWLTDTQSLVEDNNMDFHVPKADERTEIIRYLKEISSPQKSASNHQKP
jgi:cytochrome c